MVQPPGHTVPEGPQVLGVAAADILPRAKILRRRKWLMQIVVTQSKKYAVAAHGRFGNHPRLVDVVVLERGVHHAIDLLHHAIDRLPVAMTLGATSAREERLAVSDRGSLASGEFRIRGKLRERIRHAPGLVLRP